MELKIFAIRDTKAGFYSPPFFKQTHTEAERDFREIANDQKSSLNKYPEDFDLYHLGTYDDQSGKMALEPSPVHMLKAVNVIRPTPALQQ